MVACRLADIVEVLEQAGELAVPAAEVLARAGDLMVRGMAFDSRQVAPGCLFACKGAAFRPAFLEAACAKGAVAYLCAADAVAELHAAAPGLAAVPVRDVRRSMALAAPVAYGWPERQLFVAGITGTKGKSSTAYMLRAILEEAGRPCGMMGSIVTDDGMERFESTNTTPEAPELWRHLANTGASGRDSMVMEVSSQGLKYDRVLGLRFDAACFLNIGSDHISAVEHPDFEDYLASKLRIFEQCGCAVVNVRTDEAARVLAAAEVAERVVTFGVEHPDAEVWASKVRSAEGRLCFTVHGAQGVTPLASSHAVARIEAVDAVDIADAVAIELPMPGAFNVDNALAAICLARLMGAPMDAVVCGLARAHVPGRMELLSSADGRVAALVDYAHNELSFQALFASVRDDFPGRRIIAVFGAPGGKAQDRRRTLPRAAASADLLIYTEEDPGHERVEDICAELVANTPAGVPCEVVCDRGAAIERAFEVAFSGDGPAVVLLLAKGDETLQHRGDAFCEVESDLSQARRLIRR